MSSKNETKRHRIKNVTRTKIVDIDNPLENIDQTVASTVSWSDTETITGGDKPQWKALVAANADATNAVTASRARFTKTEPGTASLFVQRKRLQGNPPGRIVYRSELTQWKSDLITFSKPSPGANLPGPISNATRQFVSKGKSRISPASLGVTLGELNESLRMIARPGRALVGGFKTYLTQVNKNLRRNKHVSKRKRREIMADTWLEYSFGWYPLIRDTENLADAAASLATGIPGLHVSVFTGESGSPTVTAGNKNYPGCGEFDYDISTVTTTTCSIKGKIRTEVGQPGQFTQSFGLQMRDFVPTLWELIPWSFAIDYFTGVGDYISSMCFPYSSFVYITRSTKTTVKRQSCNCRVKNLTTTNKTNLAIQASVAPGSTIAEVESFSRVPVYNLVSPVSLRLPAAKTAYANLAALATMRLSHQRRS